MHELHLGHALCLSDIWTRLILLTDLEAASRRLVLQVMTLREVAHVSSHRIFLKKLCRRYSKHTPLNHLADFFTTFTAIEFQRLSHPATLTPSLLIPVKTKLASTLRCLVMEYHSQQHGHDSLCLTCHTRCLSLLRLITALHHKVASRSNRSISLPASSTSFFAFIRM